MAAPKKTRSRKVTPRTIENAERRRKALDMRKLGFNYQQIADKYYNGNRGYTYRDIQKAYTDLTEEAAEEVRLLELERLDLALNKIMPKVLKGDDKAIQSLLRIMERRSKYLGLDKPIQVENQGGGVVNVLFDGSLKTVGMDEPEVIVEPK